MADGLTAQQLEKVSILELHVETVSCEELNMWFHQLLQFKKDGYLVIDGFFSVDETDEMRRRMDEILENMDLSDHPKSIFTTGESQIKV